nr:MULTISPECIES: hypothetical protein [unclassified Pseudomonas]
MATSVSPCASAAWAVSGLGLAQPVLHFLDMLALATTPCALISLGAFLAEKRGMGQASPWPLVGLKLE